MGMEAGGDAVEALAKRLEEDRLSGSRELALLALRCLGLYIARHRERGAQQAYAGSLALARRLARSRPNMVAIANVLAYVIYSMKGRREPREALEVGLSSIELVAAELRASAARVARSFAKAVGEGGRYVTLSHSSTVREALLAAKPSLVYVCESRPRLEGVELAKRLSSQGIRAVLVPDAAGAYALERAEALVLGADAVYGDGGFVNKVGSRMLCLAASELKRPVYVLFDRWKLHPRAPERFISEQDDASQLVRLNAIRAEVPLFELVPSNPQLRYISEFGPLEPAELRARAQGLLPMLQALNEATNSTRA